MKPDQFTQKRHFIITLGKLLHMFGATSYRLENHLKNVAEFLEIPASFVITPTALTFVLWHQEDQTDYNYIVRVPPGDIDLGALARTNELVDQLASGEKTLSESIERLEEIANMPPPYSKLLTFFAFGASSGAFALLMRTSWHDVLWSTLLGLIVYLIILWSEKSTRVNNMLEPLSAITAAMIGSFISLYDPAINVPMCILSSVIVFIPGLSLTTGLSELAERNLISGTAKVMDASMTMFKLFFGGLLGMTLAKQMWGTVEMVNSMPIVSDSSPWIAVLILSISLVIIFKARPRHAFWGMLSGFIAFGTSIWASEYIGIALGAFAGAFAIGVYSNLFAIFLKAPATIVMLQGLVVLVPGSKVYIGLTDIITGNQILQTQGLGSQTFLIFMSLVAGLIFANVALPPRHSL